MIHKAYTYMGAWVPDWPQAFRVMNERGLYGWKLAECVADAGGHMLIFKREKQDEATPFNQEAAPFPADH